MVTIKPIPDLPDLIGQPVVVQALDYVRSALYEPEHAEFYGFAHEYGRIYRYHLYHGAHRLKSIHGTYKNFHEHFMEELQSRNKSFFEVAVGRGKAWEMYWDFESYLNALGAALDVLARVVGLFYAEPNHYRLTGSVQSRIYWV